MRIRLEFSLDEADLVSALVGRDRDRVLDASLGYSGTRLLTEQEQALAPVHQEILRKIEESLTTASGAPLNVAIDALVGVNEVAFVNDQLGKVGVLCDEFSIGALRVAIDVHRANCHQASCPVLAAMEQSAKARALS